MKFKWSPLNISAYIFLAGCIVYTIINYSRLSEGEGWGVVAMVGLAGVGLSALVVDFLLQRFIASRQIRMIVAAIIVVIYVVVLWRSGGLF